MHSEFGKVPFIRIQFSALLATIDLAALVPSTEVRSVSLFRREHPPPDARASGWLFAVQTALPVRGPSLVG